MRENYTSSHGPINFLTSTVIGNLPAPRHGGGTHSAKFIRNYSRRGGSARVGFFNTDKGIITSYDAARRNIGGQPLFEIK